MKGMSERERLISAVECAGDEEHGNCPERRHARCRSIEKLEMCQINAIADSLLAAGVIVPPLKVSPTVSIYTNRFPDRTQVVKRTRYEWGETVLCDSDEEAERLVRELQAAVESEAKV